MMDKEIKVRAGKKIFAENCNHNHEFQMINAKSYAEEYTDNNNCNMMQDIQGNSHDNLYIQDNYHDFFHENTKKDTFISKI